MDIIGPEYFSEYQMPKRRGPSLKALEREARDTYEEFRREEEKTPFYDTIKKIKISMFNNQNNQTKSQPLDARNFDLSYLFSKKGMGLS